MLSSWPRWPRWPSCCCVAVVMRLYTLSFQDFFFLCVCVCAEPPVSLSRIFLLLSIVLCADVWDFVFLLLLVCNFVLFLLFCRCRLSVLSFTSTSHFYPSGSFYPGSLFRTFLPVFLLFLRSVFFGVLLVPSTAYSFEKVREKRIRHPSYP